MRVVSWNIAGRKEPWRELIGSGADVALLQEAAEPPSDVAEQIEVDTAPWKTEGAGKNRRWRTAIVKLTDHVDVQWHKTIPLSEAHTGELGVSRLGTLAAATVTPSSGEPFIVISMYALWENAHSDTGSNLIFADASAHRLISDLSVFIGSQTRHRILAAGDLNILHGYGERGSPYWGERYATVFSRMSAIGVPFIGPQAPAGRRAEPWPDELPKESNDVPTFYTNTTTPATATRQLDFVFASKSFCNTLNVRAQNEPEDWGPSDHCRLVIDVE
jgi:endonuclease/exonuclease/phosphatase family metal-dependent hydrolase